VHHGEDVWLADNAADFARGVVTLLHDPHLRQNLGRRARRLVEKNYGWDVSIRNQESIYYAALKDRGRLRDDTVALAA
jgi:glycosyltransferase involved in cell wall biosynthesis